MDCERIIVSPTEFSFVIDKDARPYTTDSTLATAAYDDDDDDDIESGEYSVRSSNINKPSSSDGTPTCTFLSYIPRCCRSIRSQHRTIVRDALMLLALTSILASLIGVLVFIAIPVAMSGESNMTIRANPCMQNNTNNETFHQQMTNISRVVVSDFVLGIDDVSSREETVLFLYDATGFRHVNLQQYQVADSSTATGETPQTWENVQPTVGSLRQMELQPHIQTGTGTQLEITPPLDLRADHNWTISFAGSRLHAPSSSSSSSSAAAAAMNNNASESSSSSFDVIFSSSLFPFCQVQYEGSNTLGLYFEGTHSHPSNNGNADDGSTTTPTATIPLPFNSYEFHVLTLSYDQNSQQLTIYQNEEFVSSLNFENGWAALNIVGGTSSLKDGIIGVGEIVGFGVENEDYHDVGNDDHDNDGDIQPSTNLAVQRISYFHRSFNDEEEITELVQYMTSWYP